MLKKIIILLAILSACHAMQTRTPTNNISLNITDLVTITQNNLLFLNPTDNDKPLVDATAQKKQSDFFKKIFFSPWKQQKANFSLLSFKATMHSYKKEIWFGESKLKKNPAEVNELIRQCNIDNYPSMAKKAISIRSSNLRLLPTNKPFFYDFSRPGEGYPFDMLQNSSIPVNTPLFVSQISLDGDWYFIESSYANGWVDARDIAFVDDGLISTLVSSNFICAITDNIAVTDGNGIFHYKANIGALIPLANNRIFFISDLLDILFRPAETDYYQATIVDADMNRNAIILQGKIAKNKTASWPIVPSQKKIALMANNLLGQNYGWGDLYDNRDCASTLKDLLAPFGVWLPRNGNDQAKYGRYVDVSTLNSTEKEDKILKEAIPFYTLVWFRGHIMLCIGSSENGKPLIFHNVWGVRTVDEKNIEGRIVIGKTVITSLEAGCDLPVVKKSWLERVEGITILK